MDFRYDKGQGASPGNLPEFLGNREALLWRTPLDGGHSTPIVAGGRIFLTTYRSQSRELATVALSEANGHELRRRALVPEQVEQTHQIGSPATATVATRLAGRRSLPCSEARECSVMILKANNFGNKSLGHSGMNTGLGARPYLFEGKLILCEDHDIDSFVMALDSATGRGVKRTGSAGYCFAGYSTPSIWRHEGKAELLVAGALDLTPYELSSGERLWWINGLARIVIPTPVTDDSFIYMASWAPGGDAGKRLILDNWPKALSKWDKNNDGKLAKAEIDDREVLDRFFRMDLNQDRLLEQKEWERHAAVFSRARNDPGHKSKGTRRVAGQRRGLEHAKGVPYVATPIVDNGILWMVKYGESLRNLRPQLASCFRKSECPE